MPQPPVVTVLMSVFNDSVFLREAAESILGQTFTDFEFLIIDDGSTDGSAAVLGGLIDARIRVVQNGRNLGLTASLARGVTLARGKYIARMDADDVAFPHRLQRQVDYLERHDRVALLGAACEVIAERGRRMGALKRPESDLEIRWSSLLTNPFLHSTVMLRRQTLIEHDLNYDPSFTTAQDYELWTRVLKYGEGANFSIPLVRYRIRSGVTSQRREHQLRNTFQIATRTIREELPGAEVDTELIRCLWALYFGEGDTRKTPEIWRTSCHFYRELFLAFAAKYKGKSAACLQQIRRHQSTQILRSIPRNHFPAGCAHFMADLLAEDPWLPFWCAKKLAVTFLRTITAEKPAPQVWQTLSPE